MKVDPETCHKFDIYVFINLQLSIEVSEPSQDN